MPPRCIVTCSVKGYKRSRAAQCEFTHRRDARSAELEPVRTIAGPTTLLMLSVRRCSIHSSHLWFSQRRRPYAGSWRVPACCALRLRCSSGTGVLSACTRSHPARGPVRAQPLESTYLESIDIQDFALVTHQYVEFGPGLNVISGASGSGKSVLLSAFNMVLGTQASSDMVRSPSDVAGALSARLSAS